MKIKELIEKLNQSAKDSNCGDDIEAMIGVKKKDPEDSRYIDRITLEEVDGEMIVVIWPE